MFGPGLLPALALVLATSTAHADVFPRIAEAEGTVVARKSGEEARFVEVPSWRPVDVNQDLLAGDTLRTNAAGHLTIRFSDKTIVRMGRNTTLTVKKISSTSDSVLGLSEGSIWARAARGGNRVQVDTPAAAAAIRGTDWTLTVSGNQTTLTVLEGAVELSNAQGSVLVHQGEGATATIGQAPRKYTLVNLKEREQILLYKELREVFNDLSPSGLDGPGARAQRRRILATAPEARSTDDWLLLAETALTYTGREEAREALAQLGRPLAGADEARAKLIEATIAGQEMQYEKAARLFAEALPQLPGNRKAAAAYGLWFARSMLEPDRALPPPDPARFGNDPVAAIAHAEAVAHLEGPAKAIEVLAAAERRFPDDARLPAARAGFAFMLDRRDEVKEALARAQSLDPDDPSALLTSAQFRASVSSDVDGALADLQHAAAVAPGSSAVWNEIGIIQNERNAPVEADRAHRKAIELNPENAAVRANYARFLMDHDQVEAARREIEAAEALDPRSYATLAAKGRYLLRVGKTAEGEKVLLDAAATNPTYGDALIGLAIATYQQSATMETMQALDNADRFDPLNPSISLIRAGVALEGYQADEAIIQAREALRRRQLRGGYYSGYDANRQAASYLGVTLDNLGLSEWAHYYADRAYDPFKATTYVDEAAAGRQSPFVGLPPSGLERFPAGTSSFSSEMQSRLLDPLSVSSEARNTLERRAFFETALTGTLVDHGAGPGWRGNLRLQGTNYAGIPVSYSIEGDISRPRSERLNDTNDFQGGLIQFGIRPSVQDSVFLFTNIYDGEEGIPGRLYDPTPTARTQTEGEIIGGAWSHTIEERNTIQVFAVRSDTDTRQLYQAVDSMTGEFFDVDQRFRDRFWTGGFAHILGIGPVTLRYGAEATRLESRLSETLSRAVDGAVISDLSLRDDYFASRTYLDAYWEVSRDLQFQAGAQMVRFDGESGEWGPIDYRIGAAWSPIDGHWLRAYYRQDTQFTSIYTLSPISTVGLAPLELPLAWSGQTRTSAVRWDAEWSERFFTAVEYQHQEFTGLALSYEDLLVTPWTSAGVIDRLYVAGNWWIGGGLGAFASLTLNDSRDLDPPFAGHAVPLVPDYVAQVGLKYVHPSRFTFGIAQNFIGKRVGAQFIDSSGGTIVPELDRFTTTDAAITWTSENRKLDFNFAITNIFDTPVYSAYAVPAPGRTIKASLTTRF